MRAAGESVAALWVLKLFDSFSSPAFPARHTTLLPLNSCTSVLSNWSSSHSPPSPSLTARTFPSCCDLYHISVALVSPENEGRFAGLHKVFQVQTLPLSLCIIRCASLDLNASSNVPLPMSLHPPMYTHRAGLFCCKEAPLEGSLPPSSPKTSGRLLITRNYLGLDKKEKLISN